MITSLTLTSAEFERLCPLFYHTVTSEQMLRMTSVRQQALALGLEILRNTPVSWAQSLALTALEETSMRAIQAIALEGTPQIFDGVVVGPRERSE